MSSIGRIYPEGIKTALEGSYTAKVSYGKTRLAYAVNGLSLEEKRSIRAEAKTKLFVILSSGSCKTELELAAETGLSKSTVNRLKKQYKELRVNNVSA